MIKINSQLKFPQIIHIGLQHLLILSLQTFQNNTIQLILLALKKRLKPLLPKKSNSLSTFVWGANDSTTFKRCSRFFATYLKKCQTGSC